MTLLISSGEKLRIATGSIIKDPFADLRAISTAEGHLGLATDVYEMHQNYLVKRDRWTKLFIFPKGAVITKEDFGDFYSEGEIVWTNTELQ